MYLPKASFAGGYDATDAATDRRAVSDKGDDNIILLTNIADGRGRRRRRREGRCHCSYPEDICRREGGREGGERADD